MPQGSTQASPRSRVESAHSVQPAQDSGTSRKSMAGTAKTATSRATESSSPPAAETSSSPDGETASTRAPGASPASESELTNAEKSQVRELRQRDREVRAHEQAHLAAGGPYVSAAHYEFSVGPDGKQYAVGGEVSIDTSTEDDPEATVRKMQVVIRAALAPADPSPQDMKVAAAARQQMTKARAEAMRAKVEAAYRPQEPGPESLMELVV